MDLKSVLIFLSVLLASCYAKDCPNVKRINSKLICYYSNTDNVDNCYCTHVVLPVDTDAEDIANLRKKIVGVKILLTVNEFNQGLVKTVKQKNIDGLELNLKKLSSKEDITEFINTIRTKFGTDLYLALSIPQKTESLAKFYDLKALTKITDLFILQTAFLGTSKNVTFHPSRLSGLWDMQNTDSVVDLVTGLGAPLSRLVVAAPVQAFQFKLQDSGLTTPGSPALELKTISRKELCERMNKGKGKEESWILERDQDQAGPYIFRGTEWIAFEDDTSMDIKAKYTRVRGLAGLALKDLSQDASNSDSEGCGSLLAAAHAGLSKQNRAPRGAVLRSLEREILETPTLGHPLETVNVSPFRITRVVDVEGHVHSVRKDTRTEFTCTRQGYFVHPQSCGRFYRCVKFDQLSDEFSVFEFDCPAGLAFDERVEVCVWPGSLTHGSPCQGSSEIAPVPRGRFKCPQQPGYYADPENCRWFFACLDHGQTEMVAYEFRCPFGLVFDEQHLLCEWPWLVTTCATTYITGLELDSIQFWGGSAKSTVLYGGHQQAGHNINLQLTTGAQILDNYDGLASLGAIALGGYNGDITLLKSSLQNNGLGFAHIQNNQGSYVGQGIDLDSGKYVIQDGSGSLSGLNLEGQLSGIHLTTASGDVANKGAAVSFGQFEANQKEISGLGSQLAGISLESASREGSGILSQENSGVGQFDGFNSKILLEKQNTGLGFNVGQLSGSTGGLANIGLTGSLDSGLLLDKQTSGIESGIILDSDSRKGSASSYSRFNSKTSNIVSSSGSTSQHNIGVIHFGTGIKNENIGLLSEQVLPAADLNLGLLDNERKQASTVIHGTTLNHNLDQGTTLFNSGIKSEHAILGIGGDTGGNKVPTSSIDFNNYNKGNHEEVLLNNAAYKVEIPQKTILLNTEVNTPVVQAFSVQPTVQLSPSHSGTLNYNYQYANEGKYLERPIDTYASNYDNLKLKYNVPTSVSYGSKLTHNIGLTTIGAKSFQPLAVTPKTAIFNLNSPTYQYQTPVVQFDQKVQPIIYKTDSKNAKSHSYSTVQHYQTPVVQKLQPLVENIKLQTPLVHSYSTLQHYQTPVAQYEQKVAQPVLIHQNVELKTPAVQQQVLIQKPQVLLHKEVQAQVVTPVVHYEQKIQPVIYKTESESAKSHSYSTVQHYQTPLLQNEQKLAQSVAVQQNIDVKTPVVQYEQKVQPLIYKIEGERAKSQTYSTVQHYQTPIVQKVEQPLVVQPQIELKTPIVQYEQKLQPLIYKTEAAEGAKSQSYSTVQHYQTPIVQKVEQPLVVQPQIELKTPIVQYEQKLQPLIYKTESAEGEKSQTYSTVQHYQTPIVQKVEQPLVVQPQIELKTPIVQYEQKLQPLIYKTEAAEGAKSQTYSTVQHYQTPIVQKVEQPLVVQPQIELKTPIVQYEQKLQPLIYKTEAAEGAKSQTYSTVQHYQTPIVQKVEQPLVVQPQIELKTPIVQYEQKLQPLIYKTEAAEGAKSQSYSTVQHYQTPIVQPDIKFKTPIVQEIKTPVVPQTAVKQTYSSYPYQAPVIQYEQKLQPNINLFQSGLGESKSQTQFYGVQHNIATEIKTPIVQQEVLLSKAQPVTVTSKYEEIKIPTVEYEQNIQPVIYKTGSEELISKYHSAYSSAYDYPTPAVQYEQKVQPIIQQTVQPQVLLQKVQTPIQTVTVAPRYETQYFGQKSPVETVSVTPKYKINVPVVKQQPAFEANVHVETAYATPNYEAQSYSHVQQHIVTPKVQTVTITPKYEPQFISQTVQPIPYQTKVPVIEPKIIQKIVQPLYQSYSPPAKVTVTSAPQILNSYLPAKPIITKPETTQYLPPKTVYVSSTPKPIVNTYFVSSTPKPQIYVQPKLQYVSTTPKYAIFEEYVQPKQTFEVKKVIQPLTYQTIPNIQAPVIKTPGPTVVESYNYVPLKIKQESREYLPPTQKSYLPPKPEVYVSTTPKYDVFQEFIQPKQIIDIKKPVIPSVISEYQYENPEYAHYESNLNFKSAQDLSYEYQPANLAVKLPSDQTETVYYSTQKPVLPTVQTIPVKSYQTDYILSTPKPTFVSTIAPVLKQTPTLKTKIVAINKYETLDNKYLVSTPKPIYISTSAPIIAKAEIPLGEFKYYDSRYDTSSKRIDILQSNQYLKESSDLNNQFGSYDFIDTTPKIKLVPTTIRPIQRKKIVSTTTQEPLEIYPEYYNNKFDSQYIVSSKPSIATTYRPQTRKNYVSTTKSYYIDNYDYLTSTIRPVQRKKIVTTSALPIYDENYNNDYVITTLRPKIVTTTVKPILKKKKIITTTTVLPFDYDEYLVSSAKPESIKITPRPKSKTIVRVNDFHPFLTTKLGAQCTCTSNTLQLRKSKQKEYELPDNVPVTKITSSGPASYDDYNEPGVYVVGNSDDYLDYEPQKVVAVTKIPEVAILSTTNAVQPAPTPIYTLRKKVTTIRPVEPEIILSSTPASAIVDNVFLKKSKEAKIAEAVNEGLSLVKSAIKGYVKEAVQEEVRNFDRYGPGGWRSRDETLQGTVDCKRAGLFRHPTQCNKFYACHWDCTKQRYTLHVFNCPVHLTFDTTQGACNWPSKGPACTDNILLPSA